jgi:hypothetical protein
MATKNARTLQASTSNAAGATTTSASLSQTTANGLSIQARITNGATGPTLPCGVRVEVSQDGSTNWRQRTPIVLADLGNNIVTDIPFDIPAPIMHVRVVFTGNTGQAVTVEALGHELTTV